MIKQTSSTIYTCDVHFDWDHFVCDDGKGFTDLIKWSNRVREMEDEISLLKEACPSAHVQFTREKKQGGGNGIVRIQYTNISRGDDVCREAAEQFNHAVRRHSWWKDV